MNLRPHPLFKLEGRDVTVQLPVAPWEAALGESVSVPTLGGPVEMKLPAGARAGQRLRLRGRGLPGPTPGDQYVTLAIMLPPDSPQARDFFAAHEAGAGLRPAGRTRCQREGVRMSTRNDDDDVLRAQFLDDDDWLRIDEICSRLHVEQQWIVEWWSSVRSIRAVGLEPSDWAFPRRQLPRVLAMTRLVTDLGVNLTGAAIILDLVEERRQLLSQLHSRDRG